MHQYCYICCDDNTPWQLIKLLVINIITQIKLQARILSSPAVITISGRQSLYNLIENILSDVLI